MKYVYLSWEQIKTEFPNQWVSIVNLVFSEKEDFLGGMIVAADTDKKELIRKQRELDADGITFKKHCIRFTGDNPYLNDFSSNNDKPKPIEKVS